MQNLGKNDYLSDEELMELIADVEEHEMISAPFYLKHEILHRVREEEVKQIARLTRRQFITFSCKVALATGAAVAVLLLAPSQLRESPEMSYGLLNRTETMSKRMEMKSYLISEGIMKFSNMIIGKEDYENETKKEK